MLELALLGLILAKQQSPADAGVPAPVSHDAPAPIERSNGDANADAGTAPSDASSEQPRASDAPADSRAAPAPAPGSPHSPRRLPDVTGSGPADSVAPASTDTPPVPRRRRRRPRVAPDGVPPSDSSSSAASSPGSDQPSDAGVTVVRVRRRRRAATSTRTAASEARRLPGTQGDAVRVVESLPGVGRPSFGSGQLLLWGASPESSRIFVDGVPIPLLFHGSGLRSTLNGFFVGNIELTPGAYGAPYGRATAGIVQIETQALRDGIHGYAAVDVLDASGAMSAQLGRSVYVAGGVRYGYIDRLASLVAPRDALQYLSVPQYLDYQGRVELRLGEYERLTLFAFGSADASQNDFVNDDPARARSLHRAAGFHRVVLRYTNRTADGAQIAVNAWGGSNYSSRNEQVGPYPSSLDQTALVGGLRASWIRTLSRVFRLSAGLDVEGAGTDLDRRGSLLRPAREGDVFVFGQAPTSDVNADHWHVDTVSAAPYVELPISLFNDHLGIVPGLRMDATYVNVSRQLPPVGDTPTHGVSRLLVAIEPRVTATLRVLDDRLTVRAAFGVYNGPPSPADLSAVFGNATLGYTRSMQYVLGATVQILRPLSFELVGFYRSLDGVVSRATRDELRAGEALVQSGTGQAYGLQATLRHTLFRGFTGWLAYTLSRSEITNRPGEAARLSDYDQTHLFTAVASYELPLGFTIGARVRLISGLPRTPVVGRFFDTLSGDYQPIFGATNTDRLPAITSVDVRVDKRFRIGRVEALIYLDVLNVLNQAPAEERVYDPTYTQQAYITGLPILADLGLRAEF